MSMQLTPSIRHLGETLHQLADTQVVVEQLRAIGTIVLPDGSAHHLDALADRMDKLYAVASHLHHWLRCAGQPEPPARPAPPPKPAKSLAGEPGVTVIPSKWRPVWDRAPEPAKPPRQAKPPRPPAPQTPPGALDMKAAAALIGCGYGSLKRLRALGQFPDPDLVMPSRAFYWHRAGVEAWKAANGWRFGSDRLLRERPALPPNRMLREQICELLGRSEKWLAPRMYSGFGNDPFPKPVEHLGGFALWDRTAVLAWLVRHVDSKKQKKPFQPQAHQAAKEFAATAGAPRRPEIST